MTETLTTWFTLFGVYMLVAFAMSVWMAVKVWSDSPLFAIIIFLFPPAAIVALFVYWDTDNDVRIPMFILLIGALIFAVTTKRTIDNLGGDLQQQIAEAQALSSQRVPQSELDFDLAWSAAVNKLNLQSGKVVLTEARAEIDIPEHFRFISRDELVALHAAVLEPVTPGVIGWIVHDQADLNSDDPLVITVEWYNDGHVEITNLESTDADLLAARAKSAAANWTQIWSAEGEGFEFDGYDSLPEIDQNNHLVGYSEWFRYPDNKERSLDCSVLKLGRLGILKFTAEGMPSRRHELCLRVSRLMATRTQFEPEQQYLAYSGWRDTEAKYSLEQFVTREAYWGDGAR